MRKFILPMLLLVSFGATSVAMAAPAAVTGMISSMDAKACTVTLADKNVYQFPAKCDFSSLKAGEKVSIMSSMVGKVNQATTIAAAK